MAYLNEIRFPREVKDARQVMDCLRQMDDQVRYTLQNLDGNGRRKEPGRTYPPSGSPWKRYRRRWRN